MYKPFTRRLKAEQPVFGLREEKAAGRVFILIAGALATMVANMSGGVFLSGFMLDAGMDIARIGLFGAVPFIMSLCSLFTPHMLRRFPRRKGILCLSRLVFYFLNLVVVTGIARLPLAGGLRFWLMLGVYALANGINMLYTSGLSAWHFRFLPDEVRTRFIMVQQTLNAALSALALLVSGRLADWMSQSGDPTLFFTMLRLTAFVVAVGDVVFYALPKEYPYLDETPKRSPLATLRAAFGHKRFIGTMAIVFLWNGATTLSATALDVHLLERVGVPYLYIAGASASLFVFMLLLSRLWHRLLRRFGWYRTLACMVLAYVPVTVLLGFAAPGNYAWLYPLCRGVQQGLYAGIVIVLANLPYMNLPQNDHTSFFSFHTLTANLSSFFGQMLGTLMVAFGGKLALGGYGVVTFMMCLHGALLVLLGIYVLRAEKRLTGE